MPETISLSSRIDEATRNVGHLINMNGGRCAKAEEMLLQIMGVLSDSRLDRLQVEARTIAHFEAGVRGGDGLYPDWVYEARDAIRHRDQNVPWLPDLLKILGWQGGTVHQAMNAVARLVATDSAADLIAELRDAASTFELLAGWLDGWVNQARATFGKPWLGSSITRKCALLRQQAARIREVIEQATTN